MATKPTRKLAAALAVAGATMLPLAACSGGGTTGAPVTVTAGPGGIVTKAPGRCETSGKFVKPVPVDCADPNEKNPMPTFSRQAQERADEAAKSDEFPWWGWVLIAGGVAWVAWMASMFMVTAGPDIQRTNADAAARRPAPAPQPVLDYPDDYPDDWDDDEDDDEAWDEPVAPGRAHAPAHAPAQPGGESFLAELQKRLEEGN